MYEDARIRVVYMKLMMAIGHGIRRYTGHGLGMADCNDFHPMCRYEHG